MHGKRSLEWIRFLRRLIRAGIAWLDPTFLGENAVRSRYAMHSIDDVRDAVKGWLHSRRWVTRRLGDGGLLGFAILDWVRLKFSAGIRVLVAQDCGRKASLKTGQQDWAMVGSWGGWEMKPGWTPEVEWAGHDYGVRRLC